MRILIISRSPWRKDNSFGNTYSSIFGALENIEIANIYLADGIPEPEENVTAYFRISERGIINSFIKHNAEPVGQVVYAEPTVKTADKARSGKKSGFAKLMDFCKTHRLASFFMIRDFLWRIGKIDKTALYDFVDDFRPDIIFLPFYYAKYPNRFALMLKEKYDIPMVLECSLDIYTLKQLSFNPMFWINRFGVRRVLRKVVSKSEFLYTISEKMKVEYAEYLGIKTGVLYKIPDLGRRRYEYEPGRHDKTKYLFAGNIGGGRWKTLSLIAKELERQSAGKLEIYTPSPITEEMRKALVIPGVCELNGPVTQDKVIELQNDADVLIHVESFGLAEKLLVRYSISTKIMDYLSVGRCVLAIGPHDIASMEFLEDSGAAVTAYAKEEIATAISKLKDNTDLLTEKARQGYEYAENKLNPIKMRKQLENELQYIAEGKSIV